MYRFSTHVESLDVASFAEGRAERFAGRDAGRIFCPTPGDQRGAGAGRLTMIVDVSTALNCSAAKAWNEVQKSSLLLHVIRPLARVVAVGAPFPERWSEGLTIQCKSFVFGVIPIGLRTLHIEKI